MKKKINKPMRAAGILLVATMLTTCMTAGTFAKYVTTDSATDSARVAKFGVVVNANGALYGKEYAEGTANNPTSYSTRATTTGTTVQAFSSANSGNVVASGTKNTSGLGLKVTGTPEVDVNVTYAIKTQNIRLSKGKWAVLVPVKFKTKDELNKAIDKDNASFNTDESIGIYALDSGKYTRITSNSTQSDSDVAARTDLFKVSTFYEDTTNDYFPVVYSLGGTTSTTGTGVTTDSLSAVATALSNVLIGNTGATVNDTIANGTASSFVYDTNTTVSVEANNSMEGNNGIKIGNEVLTWEWTFERGTTEAEKAKYNAADTILGDLVSQANAEQVNDPFTTNEGHGETFNGVVVKWDNSENGFKSAEEDTYTNGQTTTENDFSLKTSFDISVTVTQVD